MLTLSNISLSLNGRDILKNISLDLKEKELLLLFGTNGAGKSSLLSLIAGVITPTSGKIINTFKTALCFQDEDLQFIAPTVIDDICFSPMCEGKDERKRAMDLLEYFGLSHLANAYISTLSGGEKKLVSLLGVLLCSANLLLLDEPTNHLDEVNKAKLLDILEKDKRTFIISTHDDLLLKRDYRVFRL